MKVIPLDQYQNDETIARAMQFLLNHCDGANAQDNAGFNGVDAGEAHYLGSLGKWTPAQEFKAWAMMRKYWRQLKKGDITLPKLLPEVLSAEVLPSADRIVTNHRNGAEYTIAMEGGMPMSCECDRFSFEGGCKHIDFVERFAASLTPAIALVAANVAESAPITPAIVVAPEPLINRAEMGIDPAVSTGDCTAFDITTYSDFKPTDDQCMAFHRMMEFVQGHDWNDRIFSLQGYAGTGKSTLLQAFVKVLLVTRLCRRIAFVAPTNKAVGVLRRMAESVGLEAIAQGAGSLIGFHTCHQLLALRPVKGHKKDLDFEPDPKQENQFGCYDLVIVDECSMVGDSLHDFFMRAVERFDSSTKLLWVGDRAQLRPVKHNNLSLTLGCESRVELREVVRYSGAVGRIATEIRDGILPQLLTTELSDDRSKGVVRFSSREEWETALISAFKSPRYEQNYDYARAIAFTNKRVQALNQRVRNALYPGAPEFIAGERVMAQESFAPDGVTLLENSTEYTVAEAMEGRSGKWDVWYLTLVSDMGARVMVPVIRREAQQVFDAYLQALADTKRWFEYWKHREVYAVVRYPYALTAHKSQGSTFANTFLDWPDLTQQRKGQQEGDRMSLIYTAWTRASDRVCVY